MYIHINQLCMHQVDEKLYAQKLTARERMRAGMRKIKLKQLPSSAQVMKLMTARRRRSLGSTSTTAGCEADGWLTTTTFCNKCSIIHLLI